MKAKGILVFKSITKREKGSFTDKESGEVIEYGSCYVLVADEIEKTGKITERRFKIDEEATNLISELAQLEPYTKIEMEFDITLYSSNAKLTPVSFDLV